MMRKRWMLCIGAVAAGGILLAVLLGSYIAGENRKWMYQMADSLMTEAVRVYPNVEEPIIREMISQGLKGQESGTLEKYGIEEKLFRVAFDDGRIHISMAAGIGGILLVTVLAMGICMILYWREQNRELQKLEQYCEAILDGTALLDLRDNAEGNVSILKNKVYDITMLIQEKNCMLEQEKKKTEQLLADISHQLKTPITSLHMINELLYLELPKEKKAEFLDTMQKDLLKMEWFVKMILNLAKLDSNILMLQKEQVSVDAFSNEIASYFQIYCEWNHCQIIVEGESGIYILCDKKWMREALGNVIKNAVEHGAKQILMTWTDNPLYTLLEITDDGEGIAKEEIPHIFERFYKAKHSKEDSVGLGMAFTKSMIEHHNGEIKVKSKKGGGTSFLVKFYK